MRGIVRRITIMSQFNQSTKRSNNMSTLTQSFSASLADVNGFQWSDDTILRAVYVNSTREYVYTIDDNNTIRRMKISRDATLARIVYAKARTLVDKHVCFGATGGWSPNEWFSEINEVV